PARILPGERFARPEAEEAVRREAREAAVAWARAEGFRGSCELTRMGRKYGPPAELAVRPGAVVEGGKSTLWGRNLDLVVQWAQIDEPPDPEIPAENGQADPVLSVRRRWTASVTP